MEKYSRELLMVMSKLTKIIKQYHPKINVHPGEFTMLAAIHYCINKPQVGNDLDKDKGVRVSEISNHIHSSKPATSKMLNSLEEKGYVIRIPNVHDRREVYVELTEEGKKIVKEAFNKMYEFTEESLHHMGEENTKELIALMTKFYDSMCMVLNEMNDNEINENDNEQK